MRIYRSTVLVLHLPNFCMFEVKTPFDAKSVARPMRKE